MRKHTHGLTKVRSPGIGSSSGDTVPAKIPPAATQTHGPRVFSCRPLPVWTGRGHGGQLSTLLPPQLPARPASCLSSILRRSGETSVTSHPDDRQLLSAAGCYCIATVAAAQRKRVEVCGRRDHNGLATHLAEPLLLLAQDLYEGKEVMYKG